MIRLFGSGRFGLNRLLLPFEEVGLIGDWLEEFGDGHFVSVLSILII